MKESAKRQAIEEWVEGKKGLFLLLSISLLIKAIAVACSDLVNVDGTLYISVAQKFAEGSFKEGLSLYPMPFYPLLLVVAHWFIPQWILAGQTISLLALGFSVIPIYLTIRVLFGPAAAFWGGLIYAASPWFNDLAADVVRDPVFILFFSWTVYFGVCAVTLGRARDYLLTLLFCMLAFLCRIEAVLFPLAFLFVLVVLSARDRERRKAYLKGMAIFSAIPALLFIAYMIVAREAVSFIRIKEISRYFADFFTLDFLDRYRRIYAQLKDLEQTMPGWARGRSFSEITRHNLWLIYLLGLLQGIFKVLFPPMVIPFVAGVAGRVRLNRGHFMLLSLTGVYLAGLYIYHLKRNFIDSRYLVVPALLFLPWIGVGISTFFHRALNTSRPRIAACSLVIVFVVVPFGKSLDVIWNQDDDVVKQAGLWLGRQPEADQLSMISNDGRISFYAGRGMNYHRFKGNTYEEMEQAAVDGKFDLLIIEDSKKEIIRPMAFEHYEMWKMLESHKNVALIYRKKS